MSILDNVKFVNRLAYLIGGFAVFILTISFLDYGMNHWFLINKITIIGDMGHVNSDDLSYVAQNKVRGSLFTLDINDLQDEFRRIPWIRHITVSREFPNAITVNVSEYDAVAKLGENSLISADGKVFSGAKITGNLPVFYVSEQNISDALTNYKLINKILSNHQVQVVSLAMNGLGITKINLSNNLKVTICGAEIGGSINLLDQYWDKLYTINPELNYINMCYKNALAINAAKVAPPVVKKIVSKKEKVK